MTSTAIRPAAAPRASSTTSGDTVRLHAATPTTAPTTETRTPTVLTSHRSRLGPVTFRNDRRCTMGHRPVSRKYADCAIARYTAGIELGDVRRGIIGRIQVEPRRRAMLKSLTHKKGRGR